MGADPAGAVLVTGAASGIGEAIARAFAAQGCLVWIADRDAERATALVHAVCGEGGKAAPAVVDVTDAGALETLAQDVLERSDHLDVLCVNAGVAFPERTLIETPVRDIETLLNVNLLGAILTARTFLPLVVDGGAVTFTSSISGQQAHPGAAVYSATKIGLIGLARSLAAELAPRRVRVNCVCPGGVRTPLLDRVYDDLAAVAREYADVNPLGGLASPEDVADAVCFLSSPAASRITGVALRVDGGDAIMGAI